MCVLVEDELIFKEYKCDYKGHLVITENPFVYESLIREHIKTINMSSIIPAKEVEKKSYISSHLAHLWVKILNQFSEEEFRSGIQIGNALNTRIYSLLSTGFYRYEQLRKIKEGFRKTIIPAFNIQESQKQLLSVYRNRLLTQIAELPELRGSFHVEILKDVKETDEKPYTVITKKRLAYLKNYLLGFCAEPTLIPTHCIKPFIKKAKVCENKTNRNNRLNIKIIEDGPIVTMLLLPLLLKGANIRYVSYEEMLKRLPIRKRDLKLLKNSLVASLEDLKKKDDVEQYKDLFELLAERMTNYLINYLLPVADLFLEKSMQERNRNEKADRSIIFMGTRDPVSSILSQIYSNSGTPTIAFQEGTSCMLRLYKALAPLGYITEGHAFVSRAPHEEFYFKKVSKNFLKPFYTLGTKEIQSPPLLKIGRSIGRKVWEIPLHKETVIYFPSRYRGSVFFPYYNLLDLNYWEYQKRLILNVFGEIQKDVFIKLHKKGMFSTPDARKYPSCSRRFNSSI